MIIISMMSLTLLMVILIQTFFKNDDHLNMDAFFLVRIEKNTKECQDENCIFEDEIILGSGFSVRYWFKNYAMTASHICEEYENISDSFIDSSKEIQSKLYLHDVRNNSYRGIPVFQNEKNDICIIEMIDLKEDHLVLSDEELKVGDRVKTMSAPHGIFFSDGVLLFDGRYSGHSMNDTKENYIFTIPATFGSSGSPILNEKNEVVSILHSITPNFPIVSFGSTTYSMKKSLEELRKKQSRDYIRSFMLKLFSNF